MAVGERVRGNQGLILTFKLGAATAVSVGDDCKTVELVPEDGEDSDVTFAEAKQGATKQWRLKGKGIVSFTAGSLWDYMWTNSGQDVAYVLGVAGNAAPSVTKPHFTGTLNLGSKPGVNNEARTTKEGAEFEFELDCLAEPTKVTA